MQSPPLECAAAGYFARVVGMLLFRRTDEVMGFLKASCPLFRDAAVAAIRLRGA